MRLKALCAVCVAVFLGIMMATPVDAQGQAPSS